MNKTANMKKYQQAWEKDNDEARRAYRQKYYLEHKEHILKQTRKNRLRRKYGLTEEGYQRMLLEQNHRCAVCKTTESGDDRHFRVDHCHKTGAIRGLLCHKCNTGIGMLNESSLVLFAAAEYVKKYE